MAAVSSSRDQKQRLAVLSVSSEGGMGKATTLPSSPLARRGVGLSAASAGNGSSSFADKEPLLPTSYRDASSGDLHGHWRRLTNAQQHRASIGRSRSLIAGSAYCMGEFLFLFLFSFSDAL